MINSRLCRIDIDPKTCSPACSRKSSVVATTASSASTCPPCARSTPSKARSPRCPTSSCAPRPPNSRQRLAERRDARRLLPEAFARGAARPASACMGMRHFDVQLIGGMALHDGKIAEMRTGEGKTLVATLPVYLNALDRQGRARGHRQRLPGQPRREWMGPLYSFLGLTRRRATCRAWTPTKSSAAYAADITYGTNNEFGFDYLRDNMVPTRPASACSAALQLRHRRRGGLHPDRRSAHPADHLRPGRGSAPSLYLKMNHVARTLHTPGRRGRPDHRRRRNQTDGDYTVDEKSASGLPDRAGPRERRSNPRPRPGCSPRARRSTTRRNIALVHHLYAALRAHTLYHRDSHYVVQERRRSSSSTSSPAA